MTPNPDQIKIGRLEKRIAKLTKQRDHFKESYTQLADVLEQFPWIQRRYKSYSDEKAERERVKELEQRVKEQALLIQELQKKL